MVNILRDIPNPSPPYSIHHFQGDVEMKIIVHLLHHKGQACMVDIVRSGKNNEFTRSFMDFSSFDINIRPTLKVKSIPLALEVSVGL